jgi:hypothetical protein
VTGRGKRRTHAHNRRSDPWQCASCKSVLIHPVEVDELAPGSWQVEVRCAECEGRSSRVCSAAQADDLDRELDRASEEIAAELRRMEAVHMREWVDRFVEALRVDLIGPDDFRPWPR